MLQAWRVCVRERERERERARARVSVRACDYERTALWQASCLGALWRAIAL
jgi:hypothetical protein